MTGRRVAENQAIDFEGVRVFEPALRRYFRRRAKAGEIDDLVQEVLVSLCARRSQVPVEDLQRYLFTVAGHVLAKRRRQPFLGWLDPERDLRTDDLSPERLLLGREDLETAIMVISALPERTRHAFVLHRFEEMSYARIARELGVSVSAVEKHIMAALRALAASAEDA